MPTVVCVTLLGGSVLSPWIALREVVSCESGMTSAVLENIERKH